MNKQYRVIWNESSRTWAVASEISTGRGKRASLSVASVVISSFFGLAMLTSSAPAWSQSQCSATGGVYECSGTIAEGVVVSGSGDITVNSSADIAPTGAPGTGINVTNTGAGSITVNQDSGSIAAWTDPATPWLYGENGLGITATNTALGTDITINVGESASVLSDAHGISVKNSGTGATTVNVAGSVTSVEADGVDAQGGTTGTDLTVTQGSGGSISGYSGIHAYNWGTGATTVSVAGDVTGSGDRGIDAYGASATTDLTVTQSGGTISGQSNGIWAKNDGTGATNINVAGDISSSNSAIEVFGGVTGTDLTVTQSGGTITAGKNVGIVAQNWGSGATTVNVAGDVTSAGHTGVLVNSEAHTTALTVIQRSGSISGGTGISATNSGTGATSISVAGNVTGTNNYGISAENGPSATDMTITQSAGNITASSDGIWAYNEGTGATSISVAGNITSADATGINVLNGETATDVTITQTSGTIFADCCGINAVNFGTGATSISVAGDVVGVEGLGIHALNGTATTGLTVTQRSGTISGMSDGISAENVGTGATDITVAGNVIGEYGRGISVDHYGAATGVSITQSAGTISGGGDGILVFNSGSGPTTISVAGNVSGRYGDGISANNYEDTAGLTITQSAGTISGVRGINAFNGGTGATNVSVAGNVFGVYGDGINAYGSFESTDLTLTQTGGTIEGESNGIYAYNSGTGATSISTTGDVSGENADGIAVFSGSFTTGLTIAQSGGTVAGGNVGIHAENFGTGATNINVAGDVAGSAAYGVFAYNDGATQDLTITQSAGSIAGAMAGIYTENFGSGATNINVAGDVRGDINYGISAHNDFAATNLTVTQSGGTITGGAYGIATENQGSGATTVSVAGDVTADGHAIEAFNGQTATDLTITQSAGSISGTTGIVANNAGTGATTVVLAGDVTGTDGHGVQTESDTNVTGLSITQLGGTISGSESGISAHDNGGIASVINIAGTVIGGEEAGITAVSNEGASVAITLMSGADVSAASGTAIQDDDGDATVALLGGSRTTGAVRLGNGDDSLTIVGAADISGVTYLDGGDNANAYTTDILGTSGAGTNKLTFLDTTQTVTGVNLLNWQTVTVDGSAVTLADGTLTTGTGSNPDGSLQGLVLTNASTLISPATLAVTGDVAINAGSTLQHAQGGTITGAVTNAGTIAWGWSDAGHKLTIDGDYTGNNGLLVMNTQLGADDSPTDTLAITGAVSGSTRVAVNNAGGLGAMTTGNGIPLIDAANASTNAFTQQGRISAGAYDYTLYAGGRDGSYVGDWYLRSTYEPEEVTPPSPGEPTPGEVTPPTPGEPTPELPNYRDEVAVANVVPALANRMGLAMLGTYHDRIGEGVPGQQEWNGWARAFGETGKTGRGGNDPQGRLSNFQKEGASYDYDMAGVQAGIDMLRAKNDVAGWYAGFGRIDADVEGVYGGRAGSTSMDVHSLGGYWTHRADAGWYVDSVVQGSWYQRIRAKSMAGETLRLDGNGLTAS
ncbi:autotransporter outer membrane beta-barrel domain-containing protein, partial [Uliginosibacterium sp. sgz301328]|uniref:autotransporter outer membrane beta-barrel domain-containing protein n=1 Tax=Uliginosibacterium sp. sgz301328 TaxID=3243764 RepID=UPI00359DC3B3